MAQEPSRTIPHPSCHHVDVGGGALASIGAFREVYQEGIILPVIKLVVKGEIVPDILKMVLANVRAKKEVGGDLRAQIAANDMGIKKHCFSNPGRHLCKDLTS